MSLHRADHSSRGVLPTVVRRCVCSSNVNYEEAMAGVGPQRYWGIRVYVLNVAVVGSGAYHHVIQRTSPLLTNTSFSWTVPAWNLVARTHDGRHWCNILTKTFVFSGSVGFEVR